MQKFRVFPEGQRPRWYEWPMVIVAFIWAAVVCLGLWFGSSWVGWRLFELVF